MSLFSTMLEVFQLLFDGLCFHVNECATVLYCWSNALSYATYTDNHCTNECWRMSLWALFAHCHIDYWLLIWTSFKQQYSCFIDILMYGWLSRLTLHWRHWSLISLCIEDIGLFVQVSCIIALRALPLEVTTLRRS